MRFLLALLALFAVVPAHAQAPDWTKTATVTADGAYVIGNPRAPVRLVEYMSYTCSHCAKFASDSGVPLMRDFVRSGRVAFEVRNFLLNGLDFTAALAVRCGAPAGFKGNHDAIFANQPAILTAGAKFDPSKLGDNLTAVARGWARTSGVAALMAKRGVPIARLDQCLGNARAQEQIQALAAGGQKLGVEGTPTFFLNGRKLDTNVWPGVAAELRTALAAAPRT